MALFIQLTPPLFTAGTASAEEEGRLFLDVAEPLNNSILWTDEVTVSGRTTPGAGILLDGEPVLNQNGSFSSVLVFREGPVSFHIRAVQGDFSIERVFNLTIDMTVPMLSALEPGAFLPRGTKTCSFRVRSEPGINVSLNGVPMQYEGNGIYSGKLRCSEDIKSVTISATDAAGNMQTIGFQRLPPPKWDKTQDATSPALQPAIELLEGFALFFLYAVLKRKRAP